MRAIEIDPTTKTVNEVTLPDGGYKALQKAVGCDTIQSVMLSRQVVMWVDDNGLLKDKPGPFFQLNGRDDTFAGKGIITDLDDAGDAQDCCLPHTLVAANVTWPDVEFAGFIESIEHDADTVFGKGTIFRKQAVFRERMKAEHKQ